MRPEDAEEGDSQAADALGPFLANHILVEPLEHLTWRSGQSVRYGRERRLVVGDDLVAAVHALVADKYL